MVELTDKGIMWHIILLIGLTPFLYGTEAGILDNLETIQNLFSPSTIGDNIAKLVSDVTTTAEWEAIDVKALANVPKDGLDKILREGQNLPPRIKAQVELLKAKLETNKDTIINRMRSSSLPDSMVNTLKENLPSPDTWDLTFYNRMGTQVLISTPNTWLLQVKNKEVIKKMLSQTKALISGGTKMVKEKMTDLRTNLAYILAADIPNWTEVEANAFPMDEITPDMVSKMNSNLVVVIKDKLAAESIKRNECDLGRAIVKKIIEGKITAASTFTEFGVFFDGLGAELQKYVFPEDAKPDIRYVDFIETVLKKNTKSCMIKGQASAMAENFYRVTYSASTVTPTVLSEEGACAVGAMSLTAVNSALELLNDGLLKDVDRCIIGADGDAKRRSMVIHRENKQPLSGSVQYSNLPDSLISHGSRFGSTQDNEALNILRKSGPNLDDRQMELLSSKVSTGGLSALNNEAKARIAATDLKNINVNELGNIGSSMVGQSLACITGAMKAFNDMTLLSIQILQQYRPLLRCLSRIDAEKIETSTSPFIIAEKLKDERISTALAMEIRDRLTNATGSSSKVETVGKLSMTDIDNMPVAVLASFGSDLTELDDTAMEFVLLKLGKMEEPGEIPFYARSNIVKLGLETRQKENTLSAGDLNMVGVDNSMYIPLALLRNANQVTKMMFLNQLNDGIRDGKLNIICLSSGMSGVISQCIQDVYGDASKLDSVRSIDCLMWAPPWNYITSIPKEVLDQATCRLPRMTYAMTEMDETNCLTDTGMYYKEALEMEKNLDIMQKKSLITVMEKDVSQGSQKASKSLTLTPCEKGVILGVDNMNSNDLNNMNSGDMEKCVQYLGMTDMQESRAKQIVQKLLSANNNDPSRLTELELTNTGSSFCGFSATEIEKMNKIFFFPTKPLTRMIGSLSCSNSQIIAVAAKVKANINSLSALSGKDLVSLGNILCGFTIDELQQIKYQSAEKAIPMFKRLADDCKNDNFKNTQQFLLDRIYGNPGNMDPSMVRDMGSLFANMKTDDIKKMKSEAFAGVTDAAIKRMSSSQINSIIAPGLGNLPYKSATSLSASQLNSLSGEQKKFTLKARDLAGGLATATTASVIFVSLSIFITNFL